MKLNKNLLVKLIDAEVARLRSDNSNSGAWNTLKLQNEREELVRPAPTTDQMMREGGAWLGTVREWMLCHTINGSDVIWGSDEVLLFSSGPTVADLERLAAAIAAKAIAETGTFLQSSTPKHIPKSHYDWLDENFVTFLEAVFPENRKHRAVEWTCLISAHGDKCAQYREIWDSHNIAFEHGAAIYLLSYIDPWSADVRQTRSGVWVPPATWVVTVYSILRDKLPPAYPKGATKELRGQQ